MLRYSGQTQELVDTWINGNKKDALQACNGDAGLAAEVVLLIAEQDSPEQAARFAYRLSYQEF